MCAFQSDDTSSLSNVYVQKALYGKSMVISTINNLFDCHESSTKDSQAIRQQRLFSMQSIQSG